MRFRVARMRDEEEEEDPSVESRDLSFCIKERTRQQGGAVEHTNSKTPIVQQYKVGKLPWWVHMPIWSTIAEPDRWSVESFHREVIEQLAAAGPALEVHLAIVQRLAARASIRRFSGDAAKLIWQYVMLQAAALLVRATTPVRELVFPQRVHEKRVDDGLSEASEEEEEMGLSDYENDGVDDFDDGGDDGGDNGDGGDDDDGGGGDNGDACETEVECEAVYDGSTKPRLAQTAFNFFSAFARKAVRKEISEAVRISGLRAPEISEDDLKSAVQQSWNMLAAPERLKFEEKEAADLVRFQQQTKVFEELNPSAAGAAGASSAGAGSAGEWSRVVISLKGTPEKLDSLDGPRTPAGKAKAKAKGSDSKGGNGSGSKGSGKLGAKSKSPLAKAKGTGKDGGKAAAKGSKDGDGKPGKDGKEGEKKRVRGPPANAHALKKPRTAYQVFCSEQKPVVMAQTKRAFAAKPPSDKPDGAPAADKPSSGAAPGPSGDGDAASSEAKKIALAVGVALSRAWKNLGVEGRGAYEERAEQEKALVIRDVQAGSPTVAGYLNIRV